MSQCLSLPTILKVVSAFLNSFPKFGRLNLASCIFTLDLIMQRKEQWQASQSFLLLCVFRPSSELLHFLSDCWNHLGDQTTKLLHTTQT